MCVAAYVFVPSVFGENIPTAEFGMISTKMYCLLGHKKKIAKFLMKTFTCRSISSMASVQANARPIYVLYYLQVLIICILHLHDLMKFLVNLEL